MIDTADAFARHAGRDFGTSGVRELALDVFNEDDHVLAYRVLHAWMVERRVCRSLYVLTEPAIVAGTAVRIVERPFTAAMEVLLKLRTADCPVTVDAIRHRESVLGSDFNYEDLRFWLPTDAFMSPHSEQITTPESAFVFTALRTVSDTTAALRVSLHSAGWLPLSVDWLDVDGRPPLRTYSASDIVCTEGIWTPRRITIDRPREGYRSVLTLCHFTPCPGVAPHIFDLDTLPREPPSGLEAWLRWTSAP